MRPASGGRGGWMRERHTCLEGGNYAASAASPHYPASASSSDLPRSLRWVDGIGGEGGGGGLVGRGRLGMRQRGAKGWVATVLILSKTADAAAADAAANQTHLWWYPLGYNTDPHPTFHPDSSLTPSPSSTAT